MIIYCSHSIKHVLAVGKLFLYIYIFLSDYLSVCSSILVCVQYECVCCVHPSMKSGSWQIYIKHTKLFYLSKMLYFKQSQQCIEITTQELMHITHCIIRTIDINQQIPYEYNCRFLHFYLTPRQKWQMMLDKVLWSHTFVYWEMEVLH